MLGGWKGAAKVPAVEEFVVGGEDLFVVGEVIAFPAVLKVGLGDLVDHEGVVVRRGAAFHLAEFGEVLAVGRAIGEVGWAICRIRRTIGRPRPGDCSTRERRVRCRSDGFCRPRVRTMPALRCGGGGEKPSLRTTARLGSSLCMASRISKTAGLSRSAPDLVLQRVLNDRRMRAVGFDHLDALDEHEALGELVGIGLRFGELDSGVGDCAFSGRGWSGCADGELSCSGLEVAEEAEAVVGAENLFLGEVAVEVEAVEI